MSSNYAPMSDDEFDPANLDPGIRATVLWLRERGFKTCDSGDGKSKIEAGYNEPGDEECVCDALPVPHVIMNTTPEAMVTEARRLADALREAGVELDAASGKTAQAMFCPTQDVAIIELYNVML